MISGRIGIRTAVTLSSHLRRFCATRNVHHLEITSKCAQRIKQLQAAREKDVILRVTVDGGGCSGFQYGFEIEDWEKKPVGTADLPNDDDNLFEKDGSCVIVDNLSLAYISGSKVDYLEEMISSSFRVTDNPNSDTSCGCGVSFSPKQ